MIGNRQLRIRLRLGKEHCRPVKLLDAGITFETPGSRFRGEFRVTDQKAIIWLANRHRSDDELNVDIQAGDDFRAIGTAKIDKLELIDGVTLLMIARFTIVGTVLSSRRTPGAR